VAWPFTATPVRSLLFFLQPKIVPPQPSLQNQLKNPSQPGIKAGSIPGLLNAIKNEKLFRFSQLTGAA
jgi:hypothetical protein